MSQKLATGAGIAALWLILLWSMPGPTIGATIITIGTAALVHGLGYD
ncbi:hypothetical protein [Thioclava nitratireducens]|nr:hypothetical protein [Thioclava nitratireducens]